MVLAPVPAGWGAEVEDDDDDEPWLDEQAAKAMPITAAAMSEREVFKSFGSSQLSTMTHTEL